MAKNKTENTFSFFFARSGVYGHEDHLLQRERVALHLGVDAVVALWKFQKRKNKFEFEIYFYSQFVCQTSCLTVRQVEPDHDGDVGLGAEVAVLGEPEIE